LRAAARAFPSLSELLAIPRQRLDGAASTLPRALKANTHAHFRHFAGMSARLTMRVLRGQLAQARQRLTASGERMTHSARSLLRNRSDRFSGLAIRLKASKLSNAEAQRQVIARNRERVLRLTERARRAFATSTQRLSARVVHSGQLLNALSYRGVLARGYALVRDQAGHPLHASADVVPGARMSLEFADGRVGVTADAGEAAAAKPAAHEPREPKPAAPKRTAKPVDQGSLF
jgi:exodeoxyribonuclease VII large subunit